MSGVPDLDLDAIAARHGFPVDAAAAIVEALSRGGGRQAQFSHPALGGMGQWSAGGGIMIGAMFDHGLKAKVDALCGDLAASLGSAANRSDAEAGASRGCWPSDLGSPAAVGSQNGSAYAFFPQSRRLVVRTANELETYDTGAHEISGASQTQGTGSHDLAFSSQHGTIRLGDLRRLEPERPGACDAEDPLPAHIRPALPDRTRSSGDAQDVLGLLERLFELVRKGVLTEDEFAAKKSELLARI